MCNVLRRPSRRMMLAFSPDGAMLISGGQDHMIWRGDFKTGQSVAREAAGVGRIRRYAFFFPMARATPRSPDGRCVATGSMDHTVRLWDLASGEIRTLAASAGSRVAFSSDGRSVASIGFNGAVKRWADDLPTAPAALRTWLEQAMPETIDP